MASETPPGGGLARTPLHAWHQSHQGRLIEFGGWSMPVQYGSIVEEHHAVRKAAGLFDIAHMGRLDFDGPDADVTTLLDHVTTNAVTRLKPGRAQYSLILNDQAGVIDDVLVYRLPEDRLFMVCNAANRAAVIDQIQRVAARVAPQARLVDRTADTVMVAIQGPRALEIVRDLANDPAQAEALTNLKSYGCLRATLAGIPLLASRTGYTGEDGFELIAPAEVSVTLWEAILTAGATRGVMPCGLGARDTLRFEAAMPLHGHELGTDITPYESGVAWAVKLDKPAEFVGKAACRAAAASPRFVRVGLELGGKRIARQAYPVHAANAPDGPAIGKVTSGTFAPTLERSLAMAFVPLDHAAVGTEVVVDLRGKPEPARVVPLPFYKRPTATASPTS